MRTLLQDLRYGLKIFTNQRGFSLSVILVLAVGIAGTTTMFTLLYSVILRPLPFTNSERLVQLSGVSPPPAGDMLTWWSQSQSFESLCTYTVGSANLTEGDWPRRIPSAVVSASFFSVFDVEPQLGRPFLPDEEASGRNHIAIVSNLIWEQSFGRDANILGRTITLNGIAHTVVGVMPADFSYPWRTDIWVPRAKLAASLDLGEGEQGGLFPVYEQMVGRLRADVTLRQAQAELDVQSAELKESYAKSGVISGDAKITHLQEGLVRNYRTALWVLFAGVGFLLLIACANAANLLLTRAVGRQKEIAIRLCIGAGPLRIVRQLLTESIMLATASGAAGVLLSYWAVELICGSGPRGMLSLPGIHINTGVLIFALCISAFVGVVIGLVPAIQVFSINLIDKLKEQGARSSARLHRRVRGAIVVAEVAMALVLVTGAGLAIRSLSLLTGVDPGFDPKQVLTLSINLPTAKYGESRQALAARQQAQSKPRSAPSPTTPGIPDPSPQANSVAPYRSSEFYGRVLEKIQDLPGVTAVGGVSGLPLNNTGGTLWIDVPGTKGVLAGYTGIIGDYFQAMGIPIVRGRAFREYDIQEDVKAIIINETFARRFWGDRDPVGQRIRIGGQSWEREIVGVVEDVKQRSLSKEVEPQFYVPYLQPSRGLPPPLNVALVVRSNTDVKALIGPVREQIASVDNDLPIFRVKTMEDVISESVWDYKFRGVLFGSFGLTALFLALTGVYSVVAFSVRSRRREIGIRMSLGAQSRDILLLVFREGAGLAFVGTGIGALATYGLSRYISGLLYGMSPTDPATLIVSGIIIIAAALIGCMIPARAAIKVDPAMSLRNE